VRTIGERHGQLEETARPDRVFLAGDATLPDLEVEYALGIPLRFGIEAKGVVLAPLFARETTKSQRCTKGGSTGKREVGGRDSYRSSWSRF